VARPTGRRSRNSTGNLFGRVGVRGSGMVWARPPPGKPVLWPASGQRRTPLRR